MSSVSDAFAVPMENPPLVIRNLTQNHLLVERYEIHERLDSLPKRGRIAALSKNVTAAFSTAKSPSLSCKTEANVSIQVHPLSSQKVVVEKPDLPHQILCIFFDIENQKYQSNIIHANCHTQYLMPSDGDPNPRHKHITIYHPDHHHLTIGYRESYKSWMRPLRDDVPLSALSIPGTHNSPACHKALPSVRCQSASIAEQLKRGVRFLDVRVQPQHAGMPLKDGLLLVHSAFPVSIAGSRHFRPMIDDILQFLKDHPSETVVVSVKREGTGSASDEHLSRILHLYYAHDAEHWFTAPRVPFLGEARGKIVLLRRFKLDSSLQAEWGGCGWGIDASSWADNSPNSLCPSGDVCIQDVYEVLGPHQISEKIRHSTDHLRRAAECVCPASGTGFPNKLPFFINFLTASNFWKRDCWPEKIAAQLNPAIVEYLCLEHNESLVDTLERGDGSTGIVVCDWVGLNGNWDLVRCIVGMNARFVRN